MRQKLAPEYWTPLAVHCFNSYTKSVRPMRGPRVGSKIRTYSLAERRAQWLVFHHLYGAQSTPQRGLFRKGSPGGSSLGTVSRREP